MLRTCGPIRIEIIKLLFKNITVAMRNQGKRSLLKRRMEWKVDDMSVGKIQGQNEVHSPRNGHLISIMERAHGKDMRR